MFSLLVLPHRFVWSFCVSWELLILLFFYIENKIYKNHKTKTNFHRKSHGHTEPNYHLVIIKIEMFLYTFTFQQNMTKLGAEIQLKNLGLNGYELKIWTALLSKCPSTAGQLSDIANVPRSRSYDVLESLGGKGFVEVKQGKPLMYNAIPPKEALENAKINADKNTKNHIMLLNKFKNTVAANELGRMYLQSTKPPEQKNTGCVIRGKQNIHNQIEYMLAKAEQRVLIAAPQKEFFDIAENFGDIFRKLRNRKVQVNILTQIDTKIKKQMNVLNGVVDVINSKTKARYCIVDGKEIIFMINNEEVHPTYDVGIWVNTQFAKDMEITRLNAENE